MLEMGILYEALRGSDSVCKGSNPLAEGVLRPNAKVLHKVQVLIPLPDLDSSQRTVHYFSPFGTFFAPFKVIFYFVLL